MAKVIALVFILLLAGDEAARTKRYAGQAAGSLKQVSGSGGKTSLEQTSGGEVAVPDTPAESEFKIENKKCKASWTDSCVNQDGMCARRALPLDFPYPSSQSCRLTDHWMLQEDRAKYFKLASGVLEAKSEKFAKFCGGSSSWKLFVNLRCKRRAKQMLRAVKLMSKAQTSEMMANLTDEDKAAEQTIFNNSLQSMTTAAGTDGPFVLELVEKLKADRAAVKRDPQGTINLIVGTLQKLLRGTESEKEEARAEIRSMKDAWEVEVLTAEEEQALDAKNAALAQQIEREGNVEELADNVDVVAPDTDTDIDTDAQASSNGTSLVEQEGLPEAQTKTETGVMVAAIVVVVITLLVIWIVLGAIFQLLWILLGWAFIALLGCGVYGGIQNAKDGGEIMGANAKFGLKEVAKCTGKIFAMPFVVVGKAAVAAYKYLKGERSLLQLQGKNSLLQLEAPPHTDMFEELARASANDSSVVTD